MIKKYLKLIAKYLPAALILTMPFLALGYNEVQNGLQTQGLSGLFGFGGGGISSSQSLPELISNVVKIMLMFAGIIAVVFIIIGGYQYITSAGNDEAAEKGKKTLVNAIIGIVVIVLSYAIISVITNLVSSPSGTGY